MTAIIALFTWPYIGRIVRGQVLTIRNKEFIEAARAMGASTGRILLRDVLPNLAAPIIVYGTLIIPSNILFEAALSFLGVGIPPTTPSWGRMISDAARGAAVHGRVVDAVLPGDGARPDDARVQTSWATDSATRWTRGRR
ncbi:MAG: hypothetical protein KatS3mg014_2349 [Actinomycetota bacterium]|nr:MAG: hypothetical protein KatS3mg014_2349 [Actinomycetota bacterium]